MPDLTLQQAAEELGVSAVTLRVQKHNGVLKTHKVGPLNMVTRRELERYRKQHLRGDDQK